MGGGGIAFEVVAPALYVGPHERAEGIRIFAGKFAIGEKDRVSAEAGVPRGKEAGFGAAGFFDEVGLRDKIALLDRLFVAEEGGDRKTLRDHVHGDAVFLFQEGQKRPLGAGDDGFALEVFEAANGAGRVDEQAGRVVLEDGGDGEQGQADGDFLEDVGAVALAELRLVGGDFLGDEGVGSARDNRDVEALGREEAADLGLINAAVLGFGDPVQLQGDFRERFLRGGGRRRGLGGGDGHKGRGEDDEGVQERFHEREDYGRFRCRRGRRSHAICGGRAN